MIKSIRIKGSSEKVVGNRKKWLFRGCIKSIKIGSLSGAGCVTIARRIIRDQAEKGSKMPYKRRKKDVRYFLKPCIAHNS